MRKPNEGQIVFVQGGVAQYRGGVFYTGMEEPRYARPIQWDVTWWHPIDCDPVAPYRWRPIAEIHEDLGPCVLMDIEDPGYLEVGSNLDTDFDESLWTHFAEVPKLTHEEAENLLSSTAVVG